MLPSPSSLLTEQPENPLLRSLWSCPVPPSKSKAVLATSGLHTTVTPTITLTSPDVSPPMLFSCTGLLAVPLRGQEHRYIFCFCTGHYLHGWLPVVNLLQKGLAVTILFKPESSPHTPVLVPALLFIHSTSLHPACSVVYLLMLFTFFPCLHQNGGSLEAGIALFDH